MATDKCEESLLLATLNDDCIFTILERLPLDAIYSYSRTCKRIQRLCRDDFQRRFRNEINKTVQIEHSSRGTIHYKEKYVIYFNNLVKKLRIHGGVHIKPERVACFVKTKCDPSLNEITIDNDGIVLDSFCKEISSFLQSVETVNLFQRVMRKVQTFLKYCPNLTTLSLCLLKDETIDEIFGQKYPKLTHLHFEYLSSSLINPKNWKTFLQRNSQIQCIELSERSTDSQSADDRKDEVC
ncbi:uncharacterized protein LOC119082784 [Bradysia coprophila]|uniref:uncharacterized protein LOC119082784 n=1 Tax=Bradysia coprophila TaxID=38358 RepID=UPI00187D9064|nr:uncharacterized protein LOC119082784 [Bradysia coprophila]